MTTPAENLSRYDALSAEAILAIPADEPERVFTGNSSDLKTEYYYLARLWHTDFNKAEKAEDVFRHLTDLRAKAEEKIAAGAWPVPGELLFHTVDGHQKRLKYKKKFGFELGDGYISSGYVTYVIQPQHKDLYDNALKVIKNFDFPDDKVREEFLRYLPKIASAFESNEGLVLVLEKTPEVVRLRDYLDYNGGKIDPKHAAWILSSLHNLSCYLSWAKLTHNDISPDNYFISLPHHSGMLMGGWWYAAAKNTTLRALPERTYDHAPPDVLRNEKSDPRVDLGLIRLTGRELLGDGPGLHIHLDKDIPKPLSAWLRQPTSGNAKEDYKIWMKTILPESFGARRFVEDRTTFSDIYDNQGGSPWAPQTKPTGAHTPPRKTRSRKASRAPQP